jgi:hypothetical protein
LYESYLVISFVANWWSTMIFFGCKTNWSGLDQSQISQQTIRIRALRLIYPKVSFWANYRQSTFCCEAHLVVGDLDCVLEGASTMVVEDGWAASARSPRVLGRGWAQNLQVVTTKIVWLGSGLNSLVINSTEFPRRTFPFFRQR